MVDGNYRKGDMSASGINQANIARQNAQEAAKKAEDVKKEKLNADIRKYFADLGVDADKTKTITRMVDGKETNVIYGLDQDNRKVYIDAETGKEVVVKESAGKNKFTTRDELDAKLMETYGMTSREFYTKHHIVAEFNHGKISFTHKGNKVPDAVLEKEALKYQAKNSKAQGSKITQEEYFAAFGANVDETAAAIVADATQRAKEAEVNAQMNALADFVQGSVPKQSAKEVDKTAELKDLASNELEYIQAEMAKNAASKDLAMEPTPKKTNADGVVVQGATTRKISRGTQLQGKGTVSAEDQAKINDKKTEIQQRKAGPNVLSAEQAKEKGLKPFDNNGGYLLETEVKAQGDKPARKVTTVYHKEVVNGQEIYIKQGTTNEQKQSIIYHERVRQAHEKAEVQAKKEADVKKAAEEKAKLPKKIITTSHNYERGIKYNNGNSIEAEDKNSVWDSDALFSINGGKYNLKARRSGMMTRTLDYGDLKSKKEFGFINDATGQLNPDCRLFESQNDRNPETIYLSGKGELNGAKVLNYKNKVAVLLNGKYYDLNTLIQTNRKVEIK